ncbi:nitric oxide synthase, inducible-like [Limulus polyphemus]|uniref:Nitric oxide synthase n=1 Tax=Limulus polyphemus TaxID=6850 RepID=A0ABM1T0E8_LIMPO|nr:nitric oxide synthase, inducible-like [Limulus polyphemus]
MRLKNSEYQQMTSSEENGLAKEFCSVVRNVSPLKLTNITTGKQINDTLYLRSQPIACKSQYCYGSCMPGQSGARPPGCARPPNEILQQAKEFLEQFNVHKKSETNKDYLKRWEEIKREVEVDGTYTLTLEELTFGAKLAWRNASRCIGRIQWKNLEVQDARHVQTTQEMFEALCRHLEHATNGGNLRSMITIFPPRINGREDFCLWNPQLLSYAGYLQPDGSVVGDSGRVQFTRVCQRLGWKGRGGRFDILPWVVSSPKEGPKFYEIPEELVLRINMEHPQYEWFSELGLEWYALPAVANMLFDCGGMEFPAAPFNGWYMSTEIGARDLCDPQRYNITKDVAIKMGLDTSNLTTLWKDKVLLEVNVAVLHSFRKQNVTIVDHHTASETFMTHMENEYKLRGGCPADWVWIVPPISGSITPVFHQEMLNYIMKPSYEYQENAWKLFDWKRISSVSLKYKFSSVAKAVWITCSLMHKVRIFRVRATILYATETGKSENFAHHLGRLLENSFNVRVLCMEDYKAEELAQESLLVVISSTFGSGEPPDNGKHFWKHLSEKKKINFEDLSHIKFGVFALGSSQYPTFCSFGKNIDETLATLHAERLLAVGLGDELQGQEQTFSNWAKEFYQVACNSYTLTAKDTSLVSLESANEWNPEKFRTTVVDGVFNDLCEGLTKIHKKKVQPYRVTSRARLQHNNSERQTILVRLDIQKSQDFTYEPGDHLSVFPTNSINIVNRIMSRLNPADRSERNVVQVETLVVDRWQPYQRLPPSTLRTALSRYLDITTPPSIRVLKLLSAMATNKEDQNRLGVLCEDVKEYESWKKFKYPTFADVLEEFPSIHMTTVFLLTQLPLLQPRYYSISSSPAFAKSEIHLTVSLVKFRTKDGKGPVRVGVCTSYLDSLPEQETPCFIRNAQNFHMPADRSLPIIMVGAGSGIAPFRSFWQQREMEIQVQEKKELNNNEVPLNCGKMVLIFGCRQFGVDSIYENETSRLVSKGVLHKVYYALSREPGHKKKYVQDVLKEKKKMVIKFLSLGGHVYVCGDAVMADGVRKAVKDILRSTMSEEDSEKKFEELLDKGLYHEDVFGVLHI